MCLYCNAEGGAKLQSYDRVYTQSHGAAWAILDIVLMIAYYHDGENGMAKADILWFVQTIARNCCGFHLALFMVARVIITREFDMA